MHPEGRRHWVPPHAACKLMGERGHWALLCTLPSEKGFGELSLFFPTVHLHLKERGIWACTPWHTEVVEWEI